MSIVDTFVEVRLPSEEDFLKVKETLTRIGIASNKNKTLSQSCHILHKQGRYYIVHYKEMFLLDGKTSTFNEEDLARRNTIVKLLSDWGLVEVDELPEPRGSMATIKILPHRDKSEWTLVEKYSIGS